MIQLHITKSLAKDLAFLQPQPSSTESGMMQWHLHGFTVARRRCIVAMEAQSRYAIVFCGLTKPDIENFCNIFYERLMHETVALMDEVCEFDEQTLDFVVSLVDLVCSDFYCSVGADRSVLSHISQIRECLRFDVGYRGYELPVAMEDSMAFGAQMNDMLRKTKHDKDYFIPAKRFAQFWLGMMMHMNKDIKLLPNAKKLLAESKSPAVAHELIRDNVNPLEHRQQRSSPGRVSGAKGEVVYVDFVARRKQD